MTPHLLTGCVGIVLLLVSLVLRRVLPRRIEVPGIVAAALGGFAAGLGIGSGSMVQLDQRHDEQLSDAHSTAQANAVVPSQTLPRPKFPTLALSQRAANDHPMQLGELAPPLEAAGWLNGPAPTDMTLAGKVLVVDVWADW
jgi:hypothetical protein